MLTALDPVAALIIVDLQRSMESLSFAHPLAEIVVRAVDLAAAFRDTGQTVVLVNTDGAAPGRREIDTMRSARASNWDELLPALRAQPGDHRITKQTPGAFTGTELDYWLRARGVTQVVIAGVATGTGIESTARQAYEFGYNVAFAIDAMTDMDAAVHENSVARIFPRLGERGATADIISVLRL